MFAPQYFGVQYFAAQYFPPSGDDVTPPEGLAVPPRGLLPGVGRLLH